MTSNHSLGSFNDPTAIQLTKNAIEYLTKKCAVPPDEGMIISISSYFKHTHSLNGKVVWTNGPGIQYGWHYRSDVPESAVKNVGDLRMVFALGENQPKSILDVAGDPKELVIKSC